MAQLVALVLLIALGPLSEAKKIKPKAEETKQELNVKAPADEEVCFSPVEACDQKLLKFIESAEKSLDVAVFDFSLDQIGHALLVKSKKMPVRILVDKRQAQGRHSLVPMLIKAGANLRYGKQRGIMHHKFTIVDGKRIETGSFNYTNGATQANNENQIYLSAPAVVERYKNRFEQIWNEAAAYHLTSTAN